MPFAFHSSFKYKYVLSLFLFGCYECASTLLSIIFIECVIRFFILCDNSASLAILRCGCFCTSNKRLFYVTRETASNNKNQIYCIKKTLKSKHLDIFYKSQVAHGCTQWDRILNILFGFCSQLCAFFSSSLWILCTSFKQFNTFDCCYNVEKSISNYLLCIFMLFLSTIFFSHYFDKLSWYFGFSFRIGKTIYFIWFQNRIHIFLLHHTRLL